LSLRGRSAFIITLFYRKSYSFSANFVHIEVKNLTSQEQFAAVRETLREIHKNMRTPRRVSGALGAGKAVAIEGEICDNEHKGFPASFGREAV
jgi:hypothetical protein